MNYSPILAPVVALVAWSILICFWMLITRFAEFKRLGITPEKIPDGARGVDLEGKAAPAAQWKSHNYNLATLCLIGLTTHAGLRILHDCGLINF
jgi:hypothetical protein